MEKDNKWTKNQYGIYRNEKYFKGHYIENHNRKWNIYYEFAVHCERPIASFKTLHEAIEYMES